MIWGWIKSYHRRTCTYNYQDLKDALPDTLLNKMPKSFVRKVSNHCDRYMSLYRLKIEGICIDSCIYDYLYHVVVFLYVNITYTPLLIYIIYTSM